MSITTLYLNHFTLEKVKLILHWCYISKQALVAIQLTDLNAGVRNHFLADMLARLWSPPPLLLRTFNDKVCVHFLGMYTFCKLYHKGMEYRSRIPDCVKCVMYCTSSVCFITRRAVRTLLSLSDIIVRWGVTKWCCECIFYQVCSFCVCLLIIWLQKLFVYALLRDDYGIIYIFNQDHCWWLVPNTMIQILN